MIAHISDISPILVTNCWVGIEYSTGRCELWVRPGGIEATAAVQGFICLRYTGAPTTTPSPWSFVPVDGGVNRVCRGRSPDDNLPSHYTVAASSGMSPTLRDNPIPSPFCIILYHSLPIILHPSEPFLNEHISSHILILWFVPVTASCSTG